MIIDIPLDESFLAPEGRFQGACTEVREIEKKKGTNKFIRIVFDLEPIHEGIQYRVGRDFPLSDLKGLKEILKEWLGISIRGKKIDSDSLRGKKALLEIVHIPPKNDHDEAYRFVSKILPLPFLEEPMDQAA